MRRQLLHFRCDFKVVQPRTFMSCNHNNLWRHCVWLNRLLHSLTETFCWRAVSYLEIRIIKITPIHLMTSSLSFFRGRRWGWRGRRRRRLNCSFVYYLPFCQTWSISTQFSQFFPNPKNDSSPTSVSHFDFNPSIFLAAKSTNKLSVADCRRVGKYSFLCLIFFRVRTL